MAIEHNGKIIRSLPEQVGKNLTDIIKLTSDIVSLTALVQSKLTGAMHYKGSVATVADLPATGNEVGDFYNVTSTGANYAWDGTQWDDIGSVVDLTPYARKDQNNTFSATNEFTGDVKVDNVLDTEDSVVFRVTDIDDRVAETSYTIIPTTVAEQTLGDPIKYYKTVFATEISNGVTAFSINDFQSMDQDISVIMQDYITSQDLANYATKDEAFNVIKVADLPAYNQFSQDQITIIKNGKPTLIKGTLLNIDDIFIVSSFTRSGTTYCLAFIRRTTSSCGLNRMTINNSTGVIAFQSSNDDFLSISGSGNRYGNIQILKGVYSLNDKVIPAYPADTGTFVLKCVDGTLTWVAE